VGMTLRLQMLMLRHVPMDGFSDFPALVLAMVLSLVSFMRS
jgi:hypothetical protein